jgi:putative acetyltransferase
MAVEFRSEVAADRPAVWRVLEAAFADEGPLICALVDRLRAHPCGRDGLGIVGVDNGQVVAHAMVTRGRLDALRSLVDVAVLSPVAVHPDQQGQGIGTALVRRGIEVAGAARFPALFLEGDPAFYGRVGFLAGRPLGLRKPSLRIPDDAFQVVLLPAYENWMTGTLVYPDPFWDLDCVGLRDPALPAPDG